MKWHEKLYLTEKLRPKADSLRADISQGKPAGRIWAITISANESDQLDIRRVQSLDRHGRDSFIVGLAESRQAAITLLTRMIRDCYLAGKAADLRGYFLSSVDEGGGVGD